MKRLFPFEDAENFKIPRIETLSEESFTNLSPGGLIACRSWILQTIDSEEMKSISRKKKLALLSFFIDTDQIFLTTYENAAEEIYQEYEYFMSEVIEDERELSRLYSLSRHVLRWVKSEKKSHFFDSIANMEDDQHEAFFENHQGIKQELIKLRYESQENKNELENFVENCLFLRDLFYEKPLLEKIQSILIYSFYLKTNSELFSDVEIKLSTLNQHIENIYLHEDWTWDSNITLVNLGKINEFIEGAFFIVEQGKLYRKKQLDKLMENLPFPLAKCYLNELLTKPSASVDFALLSDVVEFYCEPGTDLGAYFDISFILKKFPISVLPSTSLFQKLLQCITTDEFTQSHFINDLERLAPDNKPFNFLHGKNNDEIISIMEARLLEYQNEFSYQKILSRILIQYALFDEGRFEWIPSFLVRNPQMEGVLISLLPLDEFVEEQENLTDSFEKYPLFSELLFYNNLGIKRYKFYKNPNKIYPAHQDIIIEALEDASVYPDNIIEYRARILDALDKKKFKALSSQLKKRIIELFIKKNNEKTQSKKQLEQLLQYVNLTFRYFYKPFLGLKNLDDIDMESLSLLADQFLPVAKKFYKFNMPEAFPLFDILHSYSENKCSESTRNAFISFYLKEGMLDCLEKKHYEFSSFPLLLQQIIPQEKLWRLPANDDINNARLMANQLENYQNTHPSQQSIKRVFIQYAIYQATDFNWLMPLLMNEPELEAIILSFLDFINLNEKINQQTFIFLLNFPSFYKLLDPFHCVKEEFLPLMKGFIENKIKELNHEKKVDKQQKRLLFLLVKDLICFYNLNSMVLNLLSFVLPLANEKIRNEYLNLAQIYNKNKVINKIIEFENHLQSKIFRQNFDHLSRHSLFSSSIEEIPKELLYKITDYLPIEDIKNLACVNRTANTLFKPVMDVRQFLYYVTRRVKTKVQAMLAENNDLIHKRDRIITAEGRQFFNISAFEYALWAGDIDLWEKMLDWITPDVKIYNKLYDQIKNLEEKKISYRFKGELIQEKHYDFAALIKIFNKINLSGTIDGMEIVMNSRRNCLLGTAQKEFPINLIHFLASHDYKMNNQKDEFLNYKTNTKEKWYTSKHLGVSIYLYGSKLSSSSGAPFRDESAIRELIDVVEFKYGRLKQKLARYVEDSLIEEDFPPPGANYLC